MTSQQLTLASAQTESLVAKQHDEEAAELATLAWRKRLTITCFITLLIGWGIESLTPLPQIIPWVFYMIAFVSGGYYSVLDTWKTLREHEFDINFLMIFAAIGAAVVGHPLEGAVLMFLFSLSNTLEIYAMGRTRASVEALIAMTPTEAEVYRDGNPVKISVDQLAIGDMVLVRPGARIPADGQIARGASAINESSITGESMPVEKAVGAKVFAGTINGQGALDVTVTTPNSDTALARIVKIVSEAREQKAQSQDFTDRVIGKYYAYAVVVITALAIVIPLVFLGWGWQETLYRAMTLMVVASPCALVISIPSAILSALASSTKGGVLFKGGAHLEAAATVRVVTLDKTGTITSGRPEVVAVALTNADETTEVNKTSTLTAEQQALLTIAAAIERESEHPLAKAITRLATEQQLDLPASNEFTAMMGAGATALVNGTLYKIGRPNMFNGLPDRLAEQIDQQESLGRTVVVLGNDEQTLGFIAIADTIRPEAIEAVRQLRALGIKQIVMLTGDNQRTGDAIGKQVGVDVVYAGLLPEEKVREIKRLQSEVGPVAMIGDGINDAPALATARLGVAMGVGGTDVALETADVLLVADDLLRLPWALKLARKTRRIVRQNLFFAGTVLIIAMILALAGILPLPIGVIAHEGGTLLVVANGLRLLFYR